MFLEPFSLTENADVVRVNNLPRISEVVRV